MEITLLTDRQTVLKNSHSVVSITDCIFAYIYTGHVLRDYLSSLSRRQQLDFLWCS